MAEVWRAKITELDKRIVIKTMLTQFQDRPEVVEMFVTEAVVAARLTHPNIVDVIDFGQLEGRYYIAMEYVSGVTLRFALKRAQARGQRLPVAAVLHVLRDVCEALDHMHELEDAHGPLGLLHRDLSPDNVVVSTGGTAKLIDFGAARRRRARRRHAPSSGSSATRRRSAFASRPRTRAATSILGGYRPLRVFDGRAGLRRRRREEVMRRDRRDAGLRIHVERSPRCHRPSPRS
jgi:serine/threonine protein kinase